MQFRVKYQKLLGIADCPEQTEAMKQNQEQFYDRIAYR